MSTIKGAERPILLPGLRLNERQRMDGIALYDAIPDGRAALVHLDPQYRSVLDKLKFGNEGARQKARAKLPQMTDDTIAFFVEEAARTLRPSGHLLLWIDKFCAGSGHHLRFFRRARSLRTVDFIAWNSLRFGMGRRTRACAEYLVVAQKEPTRGWTDHSIRDVWTESSDRSTHPHAKPIALIERLIRACTKPGDLVVDPCAGGYAVLEACRASGRRFVGCDILG